MSPRPLIGLDLDGPIVDLYPQLARELQHWFGVETDPATWRSYRLDQLGVPQAELQQFLEAFFSEWPPYQDAVPVEGAAKGLQTLRMMGFVTEIVTSRPHELRKATKTWLAMCGLLAHEVRHVPVGEKAAYAAEKGHLAFLEDNPWEAARLAGVTQSFLFNRSYNSNSALRGAQRVKTWESFVSAVSQLQLLTSVPNRMEPQESGEGPVLPARLVPRKRGQGSG